MMVELDWYNETHNNDYMEKTTYMYLNRKAYLLFCHLVRFWGMDQSENFSALPHKLS